MATLASASPTTPLSPSSLSTPSTPSTPSQVAAEALLDRARRLSSNAYERARPASPLAFAEGEEVHTSTYSSPTLSPTSIPLHHQTRSSFQDYIKDPSRRRSSLQRPVSSSSARSGSSIQTPETTDPSTTGEFLPHRVNASTESAQNNAHTPPTCPTSSSPMTRRSLTVTTRPRAMTLEAIRETKENTTVATSTTTTTTTATKDPNHSATSTLLSPMDLHRKHRSENGSGLVLGVLEALRDGEHSGVRQTDSKSSAGQNAAQLDSAPNVTSLAPHAVVTVNRTVEDKTAMTRSSTAPTAVPTLAVTDACPPETAQTPENALPVAPETPSATGAGTRPPQHDLGAASSRTLFVETKTTEEERPVPPPKPSQDQSEMRSPMVSTSTASLRRASHSDGIYIQDNSDIALGSATNAAASASASTSTSTKTSRRTTKLFGKLVPKFLQTSFNPATAGGASSPQSAYPASPSPMSAMTRPTRSASFAGGSSSPLVTLSSVEEVAAEATRRTQLPDIPSPPSFSVSVVKSGKDWLGASEDRRSRHNASSDSIPEEPEGQFSGRLTKEVPERPQIPSIPPSNGSINSIKGLQSQPATSLPVEYSGAEFKVQMDRDYEDTRQVDSKMRDGQSDTQEHLRNGQGQRSPYIIDDEDCDDDFFRKSVLRKSSRPQRPPLLQTGWGLHGPERTPSLSTATSSQASSVSGSPTSPMQPMFTPSSASHQSQKEHRATTTPQPPGLDEKRSRLRDAVGEWRRSSSHLGGSMTAPQSPQC